MKRVEHDCPRPYWELAICTQCFRFTGPVISEGEAEPKFQLLPTTDGGRVVQVNGTGDLPLFLKYCDCEVARGENTPLAGPTTWLTESGTGFELCWACALTPMRQDTRFLFTRIPPAELTRDTEQLVAEARVMFRGIDGMRAWQSTATRLNLEDVGLFDGEGPARVPVPDYFAACERERISCDTRVVQLVRST